jgi:hypothetical protein
MIDEKFISELHELEEQHTPLASSSQDKKPEKSTPVEVYMQEYRDRFDGAKSDSSVTVNLP